MSGSLLKEYVAICKENKIDQLNLPDGTMIKMSPLAYYDENALQKPLAQGDFPTYDDNLSDNIDDDVLFASAR